jgi:hypothetical protein
MTTRGERISNSDVSFPKEYFPSLRYVHVKVMQRLKSYKYNIWRLYVVDIELHDRGMGLTEREEQERRRCEEGMENITKIIKASNDRVKVIFHQEE